MVMHRKYYICLFLSIVTLAAFWQVTNNDFINFDGARYILDNHHVQNGLTVESVMWAFTTTRASNWHPLTWLSHMLDCQLFGLNSGMHHLTNLLFHIANTLILFLFLQKTTGEFWKSASLSLVFALHPLRVESVAWIAERKDVLSTFFWMLTLYAYSFYVEKPNFKGYLSTIFLFTLGLLAKPMVVTLPAALLLLDLWPFGRARYLRSKEGEGVSFFYLIKEKIPFFILSAMSSVVTFLIMVQWDSALPLESLSIGPRIANALVAYNTYIGKMIWPGNLSVFYPHPGGFSLWQVTGAAMFVLCITIVVIPLAKKYPYLFTGWFWYLGTLLPVIGLIQVFHQAMADRYTYVPLIGLYIIIIWGVPDMLRGIRHLNKLLALSMGVLTIILFVCTWKQVLLWRTDETLFSHALQLNENNWLAHNNLGAVYGSQKKFKQAFYHYNEALRIKPDYSMAHYNSGVASERLGITDKAVYHYNRAIEIFPSYVKAHNNLGIIYQKTGKLSEAYEHFKEALRLNPYHVNVHNNLGNTLFLMGRLDEAVDRFRQALTIDPDSAEAHNYLGRVFSKKNELHNAARHYNEALKIDPQYVCALYNAGNMFSNAGDFQSAIELYTKAIQVQPKHTKALNNLGSVLIRTGRADEAVKHFNDALAVNPDFIAAKENLGIALKLKKE